MARKVSARKKAAPKIKITPAQHLAGLRSIQKLLTAEDSDDSALQACLEEIGRTTKFPFLLLHVFDDRRQEMVLRAVSGLESGAADKLASTLPHAIDSSEWTFMKGPASHEQSECWKELGIKTFLRFPLLSAAGKRNGALSLFHSNEIDLDQSAAQWLEAVSALLGLYCDASMTRHQPASPESTQKMNALEIRAALAAETDQKLQELDSRKWKEALEAAQKEVEETRKTAIQLALLKEEHVREISREREEWLTLQLLFRSLAEKAAQAAEPSDFCASVHQLLKQLMPAENFSVALRGGDQFSVTYLSDHVNSEPSDWLAAHKTFLDQVLSNDEPLLSAFPIDAQIQQESFNRLGAPLTISKEKRGVAVVWDSTARYSVREKEIMQFIAWEIDGVLQRKNAEEEYRSQTPWDEATLLPKSRLFPLLMSHHIAHARRNREIIAVLLLEIGQLEETRVWLDLPSGDLILKQVVDRLMQKMREGDIVVRMGEACFLWSLPGFHKVEDIAAVVEKMLATVEGPMEIQGKEVSLKGSAGISLFPSDSDDPDRLVSAAAAALEKSRELTRSSFTFFSPAINEETQSKILLKNELKEAFGKQEFALHYQPIVEISTGEVEGMEALIRWRKPLGQTVYPGQFLGCSEEIGLAANLDEWVISTACRQRNSWEKEGLGSLRLRVNISSQFFWEQAADRLTRVLQNLDIDLALLELEINEKTIVKDPDKAIIILDQLRSMGVRLAIDDFGAGGLSLFRLRHYPVTTIKMDPSYIRGITSQSPNAPAIYATMSIAKSLKIRVIAEGVETQSELQFLRTMGCDAYQGNYFSPALPRSLFSELVKKQHVRPLESQLTVPVAAVNIAAKAPVMPQVAATQPIAARSAPQQKSEVSYLISCFYCQTRLDALQADWCRCLTSDQTIICPKCGKCFCKAPLQFGHSLWERAPEAFWDRKRKYDAQHNDTPPNPPALVSAQPHVLVVDDERRILNCAHRLLRGLGYSVILAQNGEEGLQAAREYKPRLVLSDALMPKMDGREMCRRLKEDPKTAEIKLVIMTAFTGAAKFKTNVLKEHQFDEHLQKPVEYERLKAILEKFLGAKA